MAWFSDPILPSPGVYIIRDTVMTHKISLSPEELYNLRSSRERALERQPIRHDVYIRDTDALMTTLANVADLLAKAYALMNDKQKTDLFI